MGHLRSIGQEASRFEQVVGRQVSMATIARPHVVELPELMRRCGAPSAEGGAAMRVQVVVLGPVSVSLLGVDDLSVAWEVASEGDGHRAGVEDVEPVDGL
jgi:hypothetical protein